MCSGIIAGYTVGLRIKSQVCHVQGKHPPLNSPLNLVQYSYKGEAIISILRDFKAFSPFGCLQPPESWAWWLPFSLMTNLISERLSDSFACLVSNGVTASQGSKSHQSWFFHADICCCGFPGPFLGLKLVLLPTPPLQAHLKSTSSHPIII